MKYTPPKKNKSPQKTKPKKPTKKKKLYQLVVKNMPSCMTSI